jgi:hypothetical protein
MTKEIYQALKQRLLRINLDGNHHNPPIFKYVDWYYGQYHEQDQDEGAGATLWDTPAAFIEFAPIAWQTLGDGLQKAQLHFTVHVVNESMYDTDQRVLDDGQDHFGLEAQVYAALHRHRVLLSHLPAFAALSGTADDRVLCESITRVSTVIDHTLRRQLVSVQEFQTTIYDYSAMKDFLMINVQCLMIDVDAGNH